LSVSNETLRILMVVPGSFFSDYGAHVRIVEEIRALQKLGQRVTVITYYLGRDLPDMEIIRTRPTPWRADYEVGSSRHRFVFDLFLGWTGLRVALTRRFDIVHGHLHEGTLIGYFLSRIQRIPLVADYQGSMTSEMIDQKFLDPNGPWYHWARLLEMRINSLPDIILTSTNQAAVVLEREFGCDVARVHTLPDSVNMAFFRPAVLSPAERAAQRAALGIPDSRPVVVYLGLLTDYQGVPQLLQAARILKERGKEFHVLIGGFPTPRYEQMAAELGVSERVVFRGKIMRDDTPAHLALGDVAVAPKISATEGCGKILEYMAMGLPTVAFDTPQSREYMGTLGCYAGHSGDPAALADALAMFLDVPQKRLEFGQRLRERAEQHFSWDRAGRQLLTVYRAVLSKTRRRSHADPETPA
jgi:glycosyltransferase involved in cell wall biosynthesis